MLIQTCSWGSLHRVQQPVYDYKTAQLQVEWQQQRTDKPLMYGTESSVRGDKCGGKRKPCRWLRAADMPVSCDRMTYAMAAV